MYVTLLTNGHTDCRARISTNLERCVEHHQLRARRDNVVALVGFHKARVNIALRFSSWKTKRRERKILEEEEELSLGICNDRLQTKHSHSLNNHYCSEPLTATLLFHVTDNYDPLPTQEQVEKTQWKLGWRTKNIRIIPFPQTLSRLVYLQDLIRNLIEMCPRRTLCLTCQIKLTGNINYTIIKMMIIRKWLWNTTLKQETLEECGEILGCTAQDKTNLILSAFFQLFFFFFFCRICLLVRNLDNEGKNGLHVKYIFKKH